MRTILMLSSLIVLLCGAATGSAPAAGTDPFAVAGPIAPASAPAVQVDAVSQPGITTITLSAEEPSSFAEPITRLVSIPAEGTGISVRLTDQDGGGTPAFDITAGSPAILRGLTVLPVTITPRAAGAKNGDDPPRRIAFEIRYDEGSAAKQPDAESAAVRFGRGFYEPFAPILPAGQAESISESETGSYLIITNPLFLSAIEPLAAWKTEKGFPVTIATTSQTGGTNTQIRDYIARAYQEWTVPPQFVLLVGDVEQLPSFSFHSTISDHPYSTIDGTDFMPDLNVGRLSVSNLPEAETIVAKILRYERDPFVGDDPGWYKRALVVAGDYGSLTPCPVSRWCRDQLLSDGYSQVDSCYSPPFFVDYLHIIPNTINAGVSIVSYRGWAYGIHGWEPPHFTSTEIPSLTNGWKLPVVFSFVCQNNDFGQPECFGEAWLRAGTAAEPKGAVAFIGNSEPWSHTRFNDACAIGTFNAIHRAGIRRMGDLLNAAKHECLVEFPAEIPYLSDTDESVEFYYYIYNLLGDPEMEVRTETPKAFDVRYQSLVPRGTNFLDVTVREMADQGLVAGARVGVSQNGTLLGCAWTDADGVARVPCALESGDSPVAVTVTGRDHAPCRGTATVFQVENAAFLTFQQLTIDDVSEGEVQGNGDGIPNPGETLRLGVTLRNRGTEAAPQVTAELIALRGAEILQGVAGYTSIAPGADETSQDGYVVKIPATASDGEVALFRIDASPLPPASLPVSESSMEFTIRAPSLRHESSALADDGILSPGETTDLTVMLRNDGTIGSSATAAVLTSLSPDLVTITAPDAMFPAIASGSSGANAAPFRIAAAPAAAMGQTAVLQINLRTAEGYESSTSFSVMVGVADHTNPLGPDTYGYYAYDNSDTDYPDSAPLYDWIECSTVYGGSGTKLELRDNTSANVDLPFPFTYYGESYDKIHVSDNGWISFDLSNYFDFYNWHMPNSYGNGAQVAPFWDNLDPKRTIGNVPIADGVYVLNDAGRHIFVVEWSRMPNVRPEIDNLQTFELILYDPAYYPTQTGNGIIQFQYKQIVNDDDARMYATVGIENMNEDTGIEYTYSNLYPIAAAPISAGLAIRFSTEAPRYSPVTLAAFGAAPTDRGVLLTWEPADRRPRNGYRIYRASSDGSYAMLASRSLDAAARSFVDESAAPDSTYSYKIGSLDPVGRETLLGPFSYPGREAGGPRFFLEARTPNPFKGHVALAYGLPRGGEFAVQVHDLTGRLVREVAGGRKEAGTWSASWDGRDGLGRDLPSGIYLCTLRAGSSMRTLKLTLLR
jgi:hypothetical protein